MTGSVGFFMAAYTVNLLGFGQPVLDENGDEE
jgi:hypothetical protein